MDAAFKNTTRRPPDRFNDPRRPPPGDLARFAQLFLKEATPPTGDQIEHLSQALFEGDPLADAWVEYARVHLSRGEASELIKTALHKGIQQVHQAPAPLIALFEQIEAQPLWLDPQLLKLASKTFRRSGIVGHGVLTQVSLMGGYRYDGVIQPLLMTGQLTEYAPRRMAETTRFVSEVTAEGELERGACGYRSSVRVRLLHAYIRAHLSHHKEWREELWGLPINQADMAGTNLLFSLTFLVSSRVMGMRYSEREALSIIHLWRYVGHLMGIRADLLPATEEEARRIFYLIGMSQTPAGEGATALGSALHNVPLQRAQGTLSRLKARLEMRLRSGISRLILGDEAGDHLGLPQTRLKYLVLSLTPLIYTCETLRMKIPGATRLSAWLGGAWQDWHVNEISEDEALYQKAAGVPSS